MAWVIPASARQRSAPTCGRATRPTCPNVGKLLSNLKFNLAMEGAMMAPVLKSGADPKATALDVAEGQS